MACLRLFTVLPLRPLFSVPRFFLCIARSTSLEADFEYFRAMPRTPILSSKNANHEEEFRHQKLINDLNSASAQDFDKTYAKQQVDAHQEAVNLFKKYASQGDDADVKQFAQKTLPTIEHHLEEAKKLPSGPPSA
jgi:predicted outer membrane protein